MSAGRQKEFVQNEPGRKKGVNYHYVTKFLTDMITEPFSLVMYDHYTDMQQLLFPQLTSCENWAADVLRDNPFLEKLLLDVFRHQRVIGVDICGECSLTEPLPELMEGREVNRETDELLYRFLSELFQKYE